MNAPHASEGGTRRPRSNARRGAFVSPRPPWGGRGRGGAADPGEGGAEFLTNELDERAARFGGRDTQASLETCERNTGSGEPIRSRIEIAHTERDAGDKGQRGRSARNMRGDPSAIDESDLSGVQ